MELLNELKETAAPDFAMLGEAKRSEIDDLTVSSPATLRRSTNMGTAQTQWYGA